MDFLLIAVLKPVLYLVFYICVIYWIMRWLWKVIPDGKVKRFLFRRW